MNFEHGDIVKFQDRSKRSLINGRLLIYTFIVFFILVGSGETILRIPPLENSSYLSINPLEQTGYPPAIDHFERIKEYVKKNGPPPCIFFGSSLVQTGIAPDIFAKSFQATTGEEIRCYNAGMDASTLSSTASMIFLLSQQYHPSYVILGVQAGQFLPLSHNKISHIAEDQFHHNNWIKYKLGSLNLEGWLLENSRLYAFLMRNIRSMFPTNISIPSNSIPSVTTIRPEVPRTFDPMGYAPLPGYRDTSPLFQPINNVYPGLDITDIDGQDIAALERIVNLAKKGEFKLIIFEMLINEPPLFVDEITNEIESLVRQNGIPFLSTDGLAPLPLTAYSDQTHMQISGSYMFSEWLGSQIGEVIASGDMSNIDDPVWYPTLENWDSSVFENTLGLGESDYTRYLEYQNAFDLVPTDAIIFNPSLDALDKTFIQSLVGFAVGWEAGITDQDRSDLFQLMIILGRMQYQNNLNLLSSEFTELNQWRTTLDPSILRDHAIEYIVCREELADPANVHCPMGIYNDPNYVLVETWKFDPLYERYSLYQVVDAD